MTFTPSATSSFSAGAVFWAMVWSVVVKLDELLKLVPFYHPKARVSDRILVWVRSHKILTVTCTEILNYSIHGVESPLGVTFALGGTLVNILMVTFIVPIWCRLSNLERR